MYRYVRSLNGSLALLRAGLYEGTVQYIVQYLCFQRRGELCSHTVYEYMYTVLHAKFQ